MWRTYFPGYLPEEVECAFLLTLHLKASGPRATISEARSLRPTIVRGSSRDGLTPPGSAVDHGNVTRDALHGGRVLVAASEMTGPTRAASR